MTNRRRFVRLSERNAIVNLDAIAYVQLGGRDGTWVYFNTVSCNEDLQLFLLLGDADTATLIDALTQEMGGSR